MISNKVLRIIVLALLLSLTCTAMATAGTWSLIIQWDEMGQRDATINEIVVEFRDSNGNPVGNQPDGMLFMGYNQFTNESTWSVNWTPNSAAVGIYILIDATILYNPMEFEDSISLTEFFTTPADL